MVFCQLQLWLGGREHTLEDSTESPPTANSENYFCRYSLVFCPRLAGKTLSYSVKFGLLPATSLRNANLRKNFEKTLVTQNQSGIPKGSSYASYAASFCYAKTREANVVCGSIHTGNENVFCTAISDVSQNRHKAFSLALQGNYCTLCLRKVRVRNFAPSVSASRSPKTSFLPSRLIANAT